MTKVLYVGDPHAQISNLDESERLLNFVQESANKHEVDSIVILGDLYHTFAITIHLPSKGPR
jgi:metallophosphoesterase superfamily enzyme